MEVRLIIKCWLLFTSLALITTANTISFIGPTTPDGILCDPAAAHCINGTNYIVYGVQLSQPTAGNPLWTLTMEMNYPNFPTPMVPGHIIPPEDWQGTGLFSTADFLIQWNNQYYGIVLAQHIANGVSVDSYQAGNLYQAPNTQFNLIPAGQVLTIPPPFRPNQPVWLAPGGNLLGTGTVTVALGGNGTPAQYTITDQFSAPPDFLSTGDFTVIADSYVCANGLVVGTGSFVNGNNGEVPEPGTFLLCIPALLVLGRRSFLHSVRHRLTQRL